MSLNSHCFHPRPLSSIEKYFTSKKSPKNKGHQVAFVAEPHLQGGAVQEHIGMLLVFGDCPMKTTLQLKAWFKRNRIRILVSAIRLLLRIYYN